MAEYMLLKPATPGVRRRLAYVLNETSAGAYMPLTRHQKALSCSLPEENSMAKKSGYPRRKINPSLKYEMHRKKQRENYAVLKANSSAVREINRKLLDMLFDFNPDELRMRFYKTEYATALSAVVVHLTFCVVRAKKETFNLHLQLGSLNLPSAVEEELREFFVSHGLENFEGWSGILDEAGLIESDPKT